MALQVAVARDAARFFREVCRIRLFEDAALGLYNDGLVDGSIHLCTGQEAIPVGVVNALGPGDQVSCTYRGHGWALALGTRSAALFGELMGRANGICAGRASGMNIFDVEHGLIGCYAIVGGPVAAGAGVALASKLRAEGIVAVAVVGDGAVNQAYFHESLNFAAVKGLPLVVVCENNLYGEYTPLNVSTAGGDIAHRANSYGIPGEKVDGNDTFAVRDATAEALDRARSGGGPTLLECLTYRHYGHSKNDPGTYRPAAEVEEWMARDPLPRLEALVPEDVATTIRAEVETETAAARAEALAAPYPEEASIGNRNEEAAWLR